MGRTCRLSIVAATAGWLGCAAPATATLTLTAAGIADGFSVSTFIIGDNANYPVLTAADVPGDALLVGSDSHDAVYRFKDIDNQNLGDALATHAMPGDPVVASIGGTAYAAITFGGPYLQMNRNGSINHVLALRSPEFPNLGIWTNEISGHLLSSSSGGIVDIDPVAGTARFVEITDLVDGVTVSPDGETVYGAAFGINHVLGWTISTGALVFDSGRIPVSAGGIDGLGAISGGCGVAGDIAVIITTERWDCSTRPVGAIRSLLRVAHAATSCPSMPGRERCWCHNRTGCCG